MGRNKWRATLVALAALLILIQLFPADRANPSSGEEQFLATVAADSPRIRELLGRACADCHSNQTRWPWYSRVAPLSWAVADDVKRGRRELNFSDWGEYDRGERAHLLKEAKELVGEGHMPPGRYTLLRPSARLSDLEVTELSKWLDEERHRVLSERGD